MRRLWEARGRQSPTSFSSVFWEWNLLQYQYLYWWPQYEVVEMFYFPIDPPADPFGACSWTPGWMKGSGASIISRCHLADKSRFAYYPPPPPPTPHSVVLLCFLYFICSSSTKQSRMLRRWSWHLVMNLTTAVCAHLLCRNSRQSPIGNALFVCLQLSKLNNISSCLLQVTDQSVRAVAEHCPQLQFVGFMGCPVTSQGVIHLTAVSIIQLLDHDGYWH